MYKRAYNHSDGDDFGKFVYYNQRKHENNFCNKLLRDEGSDACVQNTRCKYLSNVNQCVVNPDYGYETCCRKVENASNSTNYYCRKPNERNSNPLELYKSECGLMEIVSAEDSSDIEAETAADALNSERCNDIKDENGNQLCTWNSTETKCISKAEYGNMAQLSCNPGYILNHDENGPTYLPNDVNYPYHEIYEHPFCCVNTNSFDNGYEWFDIEEDGTKKCKHGYGFDCNENNRPWLSHDLGYEEDPWLDSTKITCSILGSYNPNIHNPNNPEDPYFQNVNEGSSFYKLGSTTGSSQEHMYFDVDYSVFGGNRKIKNISEFLTKEHVFVPSIFYNDTQEFTDDTFCKNNYHDDHQYILHNECRRDEDIPTSICTSVPITGNVNIDRERCNAEEECTYYQSDNDIYDPYYPELQSQFPYMDDSKQFRINHRDPLFRRHDICEKSKCLIPQEYNETYIDNNTGIVIDRDKINKSEITENIRCNTNYNYTSVGGRYLVSLIKTPITTSNQEYMKIYVKSENGVPRILQKNEFHENGLWYKVPIPSNVDINKNFTVSIPIILVSETGLGDDESIQEYDKEEVLNLFQYPNEQIGQKDIKFIENPVAICNKHDEEYTYDGCDVFDDTCKDWAEQTNDNTIERTGVDEYYCENGVLIDITRRILNYDNINEETKKKYVVMIKHVQLMNVQINMHLLVKIQIY